MELKFLKRTGKNSREKKLRINKDYRLRGANNFIFLCLIHNFMKSQIQKYKILSAADVS